MLNNSMLFTSTFAPNPFGYPMDGRAFSSDKYRFGFNGKACPLFWRESDNEVKGEGVQQDYGARIYDSRLSRFLSPDPIIIKEKKYPELSTYQFASNSPITGIDLDGLEFLLSNEEAKLDGWKMPPIKPISTTICFAEATYGAGLTSGSKFNITYGIAKDAIGITHFSSYSAFLTEKKDKSTNWRSVGFSIGADVGYRRDTRTTFGQVMSTESNNISTVIPSFPKFSFGIGFSIDKYGSSFTLGPSVGLLFDNSPSKIWESISLTFNESKEVNLGGGSKWGIANPTFNPTLKVWEAIVTVNDQNGNMVKTKTKVFSTNKSIWKSKNYSDKEKVELSKK